MKSAEGKHRGEAKGKRWPLVLSLAAILGPPLLVLACVAFVNWRGAAKWEAVRGDLESSGESFVAAEILAPDVPVEENFAAIPFLNGVGDARSSDGGEKRDRLEAVSADAEDREIKRPRDGRGHELGRGNDYAAWEDYLRKGKRVAVPEASPRDEGSPAERILRALEAAYGDVFDELAEGLDRPRAQFLPSFAAEVKRVEFVYRCEVPHYNPITAISKTLALRLGAAAAAGDVETGRETLAICFRLNDALRHDRILFAQLVAVTQLAILSGSLWETIASRSWGEEDLRWLQGELERINFHESMAAALRFEAAGHVEAMDFARTNPGSGLTYLFEFGGWSPSSGGRGSGMAGPKEIFEDWLEDLPYLIPEGWYDINKANTVSLLYKLYIAPLDRGGFAELMAGGIEIRKALHEAEKNWVFNHFALLIGESYLSLGRRFGYQADLLKRTAVAIAAERFFLRHGRYPDAIGELVPDFIAAVPVSPANGEAFRYLREEDEDGGRYRVYSVGWDGVDDGGKRILRPANPELTRFYNEDYKGDWVWSYEAEPPPDGAIEDSK